MLGCIGYVLFCDKLMFVLVLICLDESVYLFVSKKYDCVKSWMVILNGVCCDIVLFLEFGVGML